MQSAPTGAQTRAPLQSYETSSTASARARDPPPQHINLVRPAPGGGGYALEFVNVLVEGSVITTVVGLGESFEHGIESDDFDYGPSYTRV